GPTGQVFNGTGKFVVPGGNSAPFIFDTESGDVAAWSPAANATHALVMAHVAGAVFKGLALLNTASGPFLLATDFAQGRVDVFDSTFTQVDLDGTLFRDPDLPKGYAPFNVMAVGDQVYVTYAKQQAGSDDEAHGPGLGVVDVYTDGGTTVHRVSTHGRLNAPWGLAIAPDGFGQLGGDLLVGNFGDGRINVFHDGEYTGQLRGTDNGPITIDGLWALLPGTANTGGVHTVWFSAGPNDESEGLVGQLVPAG
ncbi:MAG TPA: TIGR03118 family protein, partial [Micromonosporaceae bacterium]|nr:TIGR03118 family protein [Micromonosporaceae bacterium]